MLSTINGATEVYLILGDPVEQVRAPESFNLIFATLGINAVLVPVQVAAADVQDFVRAAFSARNIKGLFLTIPHKSLVMEMLDVCSELGRLAGAVNAVRCDAQGRLVGDLFDGEGLVESLNAFNIPYTGKRVLILGAPRPVCHRPDAVRRVAHGAACRAGRHPDEKPAFAGGAGSAEQGPGGAAGLRDDDPAGRALPGFFWPA